MDASGLVVLAISAGAVYGAWLLGSRRVGRDRSWPGRKLAVGAALGAVLVAVGVIWPAQIGGVVLGAMIGVAFAFQARRAPRDDS